MRARRPRHRTPTSGFRRTAAPRGAVAAAALAVLVAAQLSARQTPPTRTVRVGSYENRPIVFTGEEGLPAGVAVDVLEAVAAREGWRLRFVPGTWEQCLERLSAGELDLLVGIAYSPERARRFRYNRVPLLSNWGVVYRHPGADVTSVLDLAGKRVAVVAGTIHTEAVDELLDAFGVPYLPLETSDLHRVLSLVEAGEADAGVVNRLFSLLHADRYGVVATGIVFNPIEIHYAAPADGDPRLLAAIDRHLEGFREDAASVYHTSIRHWLEGPGERGLPAWVPWTLSGALVVVAAAALITLLLRRQVRSRTEELVRKSRQLEREVAERKLAQDQLNRLAYYDGLTGLPNRFLFRDRLRHALTTAEPGTSVALLFVDIDRFKAINDSFGHSTGDELLRGMAERLERSVREGDTVSRLGGDEFTIILADVGSADEARAVAQRIVASCATPFELWKEQIHGTVSIGIALYPRDADDPDRLLRCADAAMYHVKQHGRHGFHFHSPDLTAQASERLTLEADLREVLERGELTLSYQPIVHLDSAATRGVEALLRLHHPTRGWLSPEDAIPVAEESRLILEIGDRVLEQACHHLQELNRSRGAAAPLWLSVNVSSRQFAGELLLESVDRALTASGLPGRLLQLELTESLLVDGGPAGVRLLAELRAREVRVCVDDFGTGYSSLAYLQRLPLDSLKIDRTFIHALPGDSRAQKITAAIIAMAAGLGLEVIAEGIETPGQLAFLREQGCAYGQGFLLGEPVPAPELADRLGTAGGGAGPAAGGGLTSRPPAAPADRRS